MLAKRTLSAAVIAMIGGALIIAGGWVYTIGIGLFLALAAWEFIHMFAQDGHNPGAVRLAGTTFLVVILRIFSDPQYFSAGLLFAIFSVCAVNIATFRNKKENHAVDLAIELAVLAFITLPGSYLIPVRIAPNGFFWTVVCVLAASLGDVGAYLTGSFFGKHKLSPQISPNKTIEGYVGGILTALIIGWILGGIIRQSQPEFIPVVTASLSCLIGIITPLGDLTKSIIKRSFALKDTGNLIPGHGGMLDRIDTLLWAAPITYFFLYFLG